MNQQMIIAASVGWFISGVWFWVSGMGLNGWPDCWHATNSRRTGWDEAIFIYLPVCAAGGLIFWLIRSLLCTSWSIREPSVPDNIIEYKTDYGSYWVSADDARLLRHDMIQCGTQAIRTTLDGDRVIGVRVSPSELCADMLKHAYPV